MIVRHEILPETCIYLSCKFNNWQQQIAGVICRVLDGFRNSPAFVLAARARDRGLSYLQDRTEISSSKVASALGPIISEGNQGSVSNHL